MESVTARVEVLQEEYQLLHDYNPIEHVKSRLKSPESILEKMTRKGMHLTVDGLMGTLFDIAGVRLTCSFPTDIYLVRDLLCAQEDLTILEEKDYIANPKPNGYKSLHLIVKVPVHLSAGSQMVPVEIQLRTIAMDFWASLEHKIHYKYHGEVPKHLTDAMKLASDVAETLDTSMERIHQEVQELESASLPDAPEVFVEALLQDAADRRSLDDRHS